MKFLQGRWFTTSFDDVNWVSYYTFLVFWFAIGSDFLSDLLLEVDELLFHAETEVGLADKF